VPVLLLSIGCRAAVSVDDARAPEGVTHVAILELEGDAVVATSPLRSFEPGQPLWLASDRALMLLGFDLGGPGEVPLESDPVAVAGECDPHLPAPLWIARYRDGVREEAELAEAPPLTAPHLAARCEVPAEIILDVRGGEGSRCISESRKLDPCRARTDSAGCWIETAEISFERGRAKCLDMLPPGWSCRSTSEVRSVFQCDLELGTEGWEVEVFARDADEAPSFTTSTVRFGELDPIPPEAAAGRDSVPWPVVNWGQGFDLLPLADRVVVSAIEGGDRNPCPFGRERRFVFVEQESLEIRTATAPDCLEQLAPALDGAAFVAGFQSDAGEAMLGRFDVDGRLLDAIALAAGLSITTIVTLPSYYVVLLDQRDTMDITQRSELRFVRADLSSAGGYFPTADTTLFALADLGEPDRIAIWSRTPALRDVRLIQVPGGEVEQTAGLPLFSGFFPTSMYRDADRLVLFSVDDREDVVHGLEPLMTRRIVGNVSGPGQVISPVPWFDPALIIGGGAGDVRAGFPPEIFFVDPQEERYLAGKRPIAGFGPISRMRTDGDRIWALLPWEGSILRLTR
jgi:hypothetical protein